MDSAEYMRMYIRVKDAEFGIKKTYELVVWYYRPINIGMRGTFLDFEYFKGDILKYI